MKRLPVAFLRARLAALFLLSLSAVYGVGLALAPAKMLRPVQVAWPPLALAVATLGGAAIMDRLYLVVDRANRSRFQVMGWVAYGLLLLLVGLGILSGERGQDAVRRGADVMRVAQVGFLLLAGLGRGYLGALLNAFTMTSIAGLGGGPGAAVTIAAHAGLLVFFLVADHHARLLCDYPVDGPVRSGPVLGRGAILGGALAAGLGLFFWLVPCEPYAALVSRGGVRTTLSPEQGWKVVADLVLLTVVAGVGFWLVLWLGTGRSRESGEVSPGPVAARRAALERPAAAPPPEAPDLKGARARIVKLYVRLAEQLARWGVRRERFQTPLEFSQVLAPAQAASRLTELFGRARYGDRDLGEAEVESASSAGTEILDHYRRKT